MNEQPPNAQPTDPPSKAKRWGVILTLTPLSLLLCIGLLIAVFSLSATDTGNNSQSAILFLSVYLGVGLIASATMIVIFKMLVGTTEPKE